MHYQRGKKDGTITNQTLEQRFWSKVDKSGDCWLWLGPLTDGYGMFYKGSRMHGAHRISYEMAHGRIPADMQIDHICRTRACVNPGHLRLATIKQNRENLDGPPSTNKSGVLGVYRHKVNKRWIANVKHNQKNIYVGSFLSLEDAATAVAAKRLELFTHNVDDRVSA